MSARNVAAATTLFCLGLASTSATRLRPEGLPVGPGELLLVAWVIIACLAAVWNRAWRWTIPAWLTVIALFWGVALLGFFVGMLQAQSSGFTRPTGAGRELVAFGYVAVLMLVLGFIVREAGMASEMLRRYAMVLSFAVVVALSAALVFRERGLGSLWYQNLRFTGFAENPNQLALFLVPMPFTILQLHEDGSLARITTMFCLMAVTVAGIATLSDALALAWLVGGALSGALLLSKGSHLPGGSLARVATIWVLLPAMLVVGMLVAGPSIYSRLESAVTDVVQEGSQASIRMTLWKHGLEAIAQAPWTGWGPGAHSGIRGAFEGIEAHSSYVDWAAGTGVFGLGALLLVLGWSMWCCMRAGKFHFLAALLALIVFAAFHFVLRQPAFWLTILLIAIASSPPSGREYRGVPEAGRQVP